MKPPNFQVVSIIGIGLIGGSLGMALKQRGLAKKVIGVARTEKTLSTALQQGAADEVTSNSLEAVAEADLVFLSTPVLQIPALLRSIAPKLPRNCIVSDTGSSKQMIVEAASSLGSLRFVGGHPMAGSENKGVEHARPDLFEGAVYFLTQTEKTDPEALTALSDLAEELGAKPLILSPERHDRIVAATSHLPHVLAAALVKLAQRAKEADPLVLQGMATGFKDATRIASGDPEMWSDIFISNRERILEALKEWEGITGELEKILEAGDRSGLISWLSEAKAFREEVYPPK